MSPQNVPSTALAETVNRGFSKQSFGYDRSDRQNPVLQDLRQQVYAHARLYLKPGSKILELNAGTGIDATRFASDGHVVHATDVSDGMVDQIKLKIASGNFATHLTCQQLSFEHLDLVPSGNFDYVFSNFGGLNCTPDLSWVTRHLPSLLKRGAYVTWVIMPPICPWELLLILKGKWKHAFRRWKRKGTLSHLEGEYFHTYYHSLKKIKKAFGPAFRFVRAEGLASLSPPPHRADVPLKKPRLYRFLRIADGCVRDFFPFNRCADHIIVTMQYKPRP